jgi:hypothetical protein
MGRRYVIKREPTSSLTVYLVDSLLVDDARIQSDQSKTDTVRRIFIEYFGEDKVKAKLKELQKKADRQAVIGGSRGDQSTIDGIYFPKKEFKDICYNQDDLLDIIIEAKGFSGSLAKARALDSLTKAVNRGDIKRDLGGFRIIRRYWEDNIVRA